MALDSGLSSEMDESDVIVSDTLVTTDSRKEIQYLSWHRDGTPLETRR